MIIMMSLYAGPNADYSGLVQTLTFLSSEAEIFVDIQITSDFIFESDETFTAIVSQAMPSSNIVIVEAEATVLIRNDESKL